ncbi:MAG: hypothetical protein R6W96_01405 [Clostridia bacterium]
MLEAMIGRAKNGENLYITHVRADFGKAADKKTLLLELDLIQPGEKRYFEIAIPGGNVLDQEETKFLKSYVMAEVYNILSAIGGMKLTAYIDTGDRLLQEIVGGISPGFCIGLPLSERTHYGNCINVIDRMVKAIHGQESRFELVIRDDSERPVVPYREKVRATHSDILRQVAGKLEGKTICGIDIGGTDIKVAISVDGLISCFKEYDWNPAAFATACQLVDPILDLTRLVVAYASFRKAPGLSNPEMKAMMEKAMDKEASISQIRETVTMAENILKDFCIRPDAIGVSFPDVVVRDKIVGGETTKTRGMKRNEAIDYEREFAKITDLDCRLKELCKENAAVKITNDGPMSAYTAAVELTVVNPGKVRDGVFAHSLGTEIGTGWVDAEGRVPEMPLECYNMIIDLGNFVEKEHPAEDVRSINNVNTGLSGTLQRYTSQGGVFRMAMQVFGKKRPDLYQEILDKGFVHVKEVDGRRVLHVPTEPKDMRKGFLEHLMSLPDREQDDSVHGIFREIGVYMAITWLETEYLLEPACKERTLFGRLVKTKTCYDLIVEGARSIKPDIMLEIADGSMANTSLMKQLEADKHYTVAQFAQAVGAIYYANQGLLEQ